MLDRGRRIDVGGLELHVEEHGDGEPVVVLHGFAGSTRAMTPLIVALAEERRAIALDLIGHGRSDAPQEASAYAWAAVTRHVPRILDVLRIPHAHLFGFSLGGRIALQVAARHEQRVRSAFTVGSRCAWPASQDREAYRANDARLAGEIERAGVAALAAPHHGADAIAAATPRAGAHGLALALRALGAADQPDVGAQLAASALPVCMIVGTEDVGPLAAARALASDLPCARLIEIEGAGHRAHLEQTARVARLALAFFAEVDEELANHSGVRARRAAAHEESRRWSM